VCHVAYSPAEVSAGISFVLSLAGLLPCVLRGRFEQRRERDEKRERERNERDRENREKRGNGLVFPLKTVVVSFKDCNSPQETRFGHGSRAVATRCDSGHAAAVALPSPG
jgi:hypothetical protein